MKQSIQAKTDAVAFCGSRAEHTMGYFGGTPVSRSFINGTSLLEGVSCHMFPESLLRYCCVTGLSLDQAGFSTGYPKNICLILKDESPTGQTIPLAPGFFFFFPGVGWGGVGRVGWGQSGLQVKQKRGDGLLRLWSRAEASLGQLYQVLSCFALCWFSGVPNAEYPLSGVNHSS